MGGATVVYACANDATDAIHLLAQVPELGRFIGIFRVANTVPHGNKHGVKRASVSKALANAVASSST